MIDKEPKVGRYLVKDTVFLHGSCSCSGGIITKISGKRIYFIGLDNREEYCSKFAAICDTPEEAKMLMEFSKWCIQEHVELDKKQREEWKSFFN